jgi:hypothetical protein
MGKVKQLMAKRCDICPPCNYARANPDSMVGKAIHFHGKFCPFWKAWQEVYGDKAEGESSGS